MALNTVVPKHIIQRHRWHTVRSTILKCHCLNGSIMRHKHASVIEHRWGQCTKFLSSHSFSSQHKFDVATCPNHMLAYNGEDTRKRLFSTTHAYHSSHQSPSLLNVENTENLSQGKENGDTAELRSIELTFVGGRDRPVRVKASYLDLCGSPPDLTGPECNSQPVVLALHGSPGSHKDMMPILQPLLERGCRVIAPNFPGYGYTVPKTQGDHEALYHCTKERTNFVLSLLQAISIDRVDTVIGHSGGSFPAIQLVHDHPNVYKSACLLTPPPVHSLIRLVRPFWLTRAVAAGSDVALLRPLVSTVIWVAFKFLAFETKKIDPMIVATQTGARLDFPKITEMAGTLAQRKLPLVFVYSKNDPFIEWHLSREYAVDILGAPQEAIHVQGKDGQLLNTPVTPADRYIRVFQMAKAAHFPQRKAQYLPTVVEETWKLIQHVQQLDTPASSS